MKRQSSFLFALAALMVLTLPGVAGAGDAIQFSGCNQVDQPSLPESDTAYRDAMNLGRTLINHHFIVTCISPSQMTGTFEGQEGAATYRTNQGDFEALFMPKPQNFDRLRIIERRDGGSYRYSFAGPPKPWPANLIDSSFPMYFIKHGNELIVAEDEQVANKVNSAIGGR